MYTRINKLRELLNKEHLDSLFVTNQYNVMYLTNFSGLSQNEREAFFLLTPKKACLFTFPTYFGLYKDGGHGFDVLNITINKRLHHHLNKIIEKEKIKLMAVEKESLTLAEFESLNKKLKVKLRETEGLIEKLRLIKSEQEIAAIKKAALIGDKAFEFIKIKIKNNISEKTLAIDLECFIKQQADGIAFSPIVAFNKNAAIPHYLPSNSQRLKINSLILLDFGAKINGYCSDMTRVIFFGKPKSYQVKAYRSVLKAQQLALDKLKVGIKCAKIDKLIKHHLASYGYPAYQHGLGHGVGLAVHEAPKLKIGSNEKLAENMVVTIEPGIYIEGKYGIRIEDLVVLKRDGIEILSKSSKELLIVSS